MVCRPWLAVLAAALLSAPGMAQTPAPAESSIPAAQPVSATEPAQPPAASQAVQLAPAKKTVTVPAGTKVLLQLRSAVNTKSARPGDGVYLASIFPVVV
ncbi:MAG TPA: hypothetical protein VMD29_01525, partial [Terracidiphilus sp.]|nr:hypothetical protein [Terracidiphilus sp.]